MLWSLLLVTFIIWCGYYRWSRRRLHQLAKQIKCDLTSLPFIGHAHHLIGDGTDKLNAIKLIGREALKHGGLTHAWLGPQLFIVPADVDIMEVILKKCIEKHDVMSFFMIATGNGSIFAPVSIWRPRRKIMAPTFSPKNLNTFVDVFSKQSSIMVSLLKQAPKGSFPIWDYITTYTMDAICETTLGFKAKSQFNPDQPFLKAFDCFSRLVAECMLSPWLHYLSVYKITPQYTILMKSKGVMDDFIGQLIKTKRQEYNDKSYKEVSSPGRAVDADDSFKTFIELLIEVGGEKGFNDLELQEEAMVMVMAGTDTSAVGASYTAVMLSRHQDVQEKVYQELLKVLGKTDRPIVAEDLPRLKYLDAVIKETLRLHPPVPITVRKVERDITLPSGVSLVDGCGILINIWALHRNPMYWGSDAEEFRPERFFEVYDKRAFMPFSSGPRSCLGYQYAMMSMKTALASLIRQYRVLPAEEDIIHDGLNTKYKPIQETFAIMMKDVKKFQVRLKCRND